jgi:hypothetical protein
MDARRQIGFAQAAEALSAMVGSRVSVRIVERTRPQNLLAVFEGVLSEPSSEKAPARFWPLETGLDERPGAAERAGVVLHEELFDGAESRAGDAILLLAQGQTLTNIRRL